MKAKVLVLALGIILLFIVGSGCLGEHQTCPECKGTGRNKVTIGYQDFYTDECENCYGDGKVGLFMDDEDAEDGLSALWVVVIIIVVIAIIIMGGDSELLHNSELLHSIWMKAPKLPQPPSQQPPQQPYYPPQQQPPPPSDYRPPK